MTAAALNRVLDALPRTRLARHGREVPAFLTCGVTGFYVAVVVTLAGGLVTGRSLLVLCVMALVCALSFFVYVYARRALTGRETMVLLDQVWFAEACMAGALVALGEPVLAYMDVVSVAICFFLVGGRTGCLLAGCCHGNPSSVGIVYPDAAARDGFSAHLAGVRLFPVQAVEAAGLAAIGVSGFAALPFARPGAVLLWIMCAYAVMRFGLEGLRGDVRSHLLGLSRARWMALAELAFAVWIAERAYGGGISTREAVLGGILLAALAGGLVARWAFDRRRVVGSAAHRREVEAAARALLPTALRDGPGEAPPLRTTARGATVAASLVRVDGRDALHVSLALPQGVRDLPLLCSLAAGAIPGASPTAARVSDDGVLHLLLRPPFVAEPAEGDAAERLGRTIYGAVVRALQRAEAPAPPSSTPEAGNAGEPAEAAAALPDRRVAYFGRRAADGARG